MGNILQFRPIDKRKRCDACGALFLPRMHYHRSCFRCFKTDRAIRALATANRLWNEITGGSR